MTPPRHSTPPGTDRAVGLRRPDPPQGDPGAKGRTTAWLHCFAGIAGDMVLGALLDAGADLDEVLGLLRRIPISGWDLRVDPVLRGGVACTRAVVSASDDVVVRTHAHIIGLVSEARLPERVRSRALAVFDALATVEGTLHRRPPGQVHFHEVGGHDAVIDVVGTAAALEILGVDDLVASPIATGTGMVRTAHGLLPNPAPAVLRLLRGIPTYGRETSVELTTPTGAAIVASLCRAFGPMPPMTIACVGFGAGARELDDLPNCTQVVIGAAEPGPPNDGGQPIVVLETNVDDATGEQLAYALNRLLDAGAHDAWVTANVMKKGRPGHTVHVLADPALVGPLRETLRQTTRTLGVRAVRAERWPVARTVSEVEVAGVTVRMKVADGRAKPEFDDLLAVARRSGLPIDEAASRAQEAWRRDHGGDAPTSSRSWATPGDDPEPA